MKKGVLFKGVIYMNKNIYCKAFDIKAIDESVCLHLYKNVDDEESVAFTGLDIEAAEALCEMLKQEIEKAKSSKFII